jgi:hypothetical protein
VESILFVSSWCILVSRICGTKSLAQTWITKLYFPHYLFVFPVSSCVDRFFLLGGGYSRGPLLIATISFKKSQQFIGFPFVFQLIYFFLFYISDIYFALPTPIFLTLGLCCPGRSLHFLRVSPNRRKYLSEIKRRELLDKTGGFWSRLRSYGTYLPIGATTSLSLVCPPSCSFQMYTSISWSCGSYISS